MNCVVCGSPVVNRGKGCVTCSSDCNAIKKSGLTAEEYWRRQCQVPRDEYERSHELDDDTALERVVRIGMRKDL